MQKIRVSWYKLNDSNWFLRIEQNRRMLAHVWVDEIGMAHAEIIKSTYIGAFKSIADAKQSVELCLGVNPDINQ